MQSQTSSSSMGTILILLLALYGVWGAAAQYKWIQLRDTSPPDRRVGSAAAYCSTRDSMIMFGGYRVFPLSGRTDYSNDLWEYNFVADTWTEIVLPVKPSPRVWSAMVAIENVTVQGDCQVLLYGGVGLKDNSTAGNLLDFDEAWLFSIVNQTMQWEKLDAPNGPGARSMMQMAYRRGSLVMFGGSRLLPPFPSSTAIAFNDIWSLTIGAKNESGVRAPSVWTSIVRQNSSAVWPDARFSHVMGLQLGASSDADELIIYAGRKYVTQSDWVMLSDLMVYSFGTGTWRLANGLQLERALHSGVVFNGRFISFGGGTRIPTSPTTSASYVFNTVLVTNIDPALNTNIGDGTVGQPECTASDGKYGLWCVVDIAKDDVEPTVRYNFPYILRKDQLIVYGGQFQDFLGDMWALNISQAVKELDIAEADSLGASDLASTMYFMIAILSMMVVCFIVFVISLRRQRGNVPMFQGVMANRPRVIGARQSVIEALPLKTYTKKEADERRQSRRQSRLESQRSIKVPPAADANPAAETSTVLAPAADPSGDRIEQDDLHDMCAICLMDYEDGEQLRVLPCDHFFHPPCIDQWLRQHNACPMCKAAVDLDPERSEEPNPDQQVVPAGEASDNPAFRAGQSTATGSNNEPRVGESSITNGGDDAEAQRFEISGSRADSSVIPIRAASSAQGEDVVVIDLSQAPRRQSSTAVAPPAQNSEMQVIDLSDNGQGRPHDSANV